MPDVCMSSKKNRPVPFDKAEWIFVDFELDGYCLLTKNEKGKINAFMRERMKQPHGKSELWCFYKIQYATETHYYAFPFLGTGFQARSLDDLLRKIENLPVRNF